MYTYLSLKCFCSAFYVSFQTFKLLLQQKAPGAVFVYFRKTYIRNRSFVLLLQLLYVHEYIIRLRVLNISVAIFLWLRTKSSLFPATRTTHRITSIFINIRPTLYRQHGSVHSGTVSKLSNTKRRSGTRGQPQNYLKAPKIQFSK